MYTLINYKKPGYFESQVLENFFIRNVYDFVEETNNNDVLQKKHFDKKQTKRQSYVNN